MLFAGGALFFSLFTGCKQGIGDRCEVPGDCSSNFCVQTASPGNGICCDQFNLAACPIPQTGSGGSSGTAGAGGTSQTADAADAPTSTTDDGSTDSGTD
jgi:hypothetical protein